MLHHLLQLELLRMLQSFIDKSWLRWTFKMHSLMVIIKRKFICSHLLGVLIPLDKFADCVGPLCLKQPPQAWFSRFSSMVLLDVHQALMSLFSLFRSLNTFIIGDDISAVSEIKSYL